MDEASRWNLLIEKNDIFEIVHTLDLGFRSSLLTSLGLSIAAIRDQTRDDKSRALFRGRLDRITFDFTPETKPRMDRLTDC